MRFNDRALSSNIDYVEHRTDFRFVLKVLIGILFDIAVL